MSEVRAEDVEEMDRNIKDVSISKRLKLEKQQQNDEMQFRLNNNGLSREEIASKVAAEIHESTQ